MMVTYEIDEEARKVRLSTLPFRVGFKLFEGLGWLPVEERIKRAHEGDEYQIAFMTCRDELIDRGLIQG